MIEAKKNDICLLQEDGNIFKGILIVTGFADKSSRKYMKILSSDQKIIDDLVKCLTWTFGEDLFIKIKKDNPIAEILLGTRVYNLIFRKNSKNSFQGYGFKALGKIRDKEILFYRAYNSRFDYSKKRRYIKEDDMIEDK